MIFIKKKKNPVLSLFLLLLSFYTIFYIFYLAGYLKETEKEKTVLTKEAIEKFEEDVSLGKDVTLEDYLSYDIKDYSTKISKIGNKAAGILEYIMDEGISNSINIIKKLFS